MVRFVAAIAITRKWDENGMKMGWEWDENGAVGCGSMGAWGHGWEEAPVGLTGSATGGDGVKLL